MNTQNQTCQAIPESPIQRANQRLMTAQAETEKIIEELKMRISAVLRPDSLKEQGCGNKTAPRDIAAPLTDGTNDRAGQQEIINSRLVDVISRIEL